MLRVKGLEMRRFGIWPSSERNFRLRPGAYGILPRGDKILLTHQLDSSEPFQLPGGGIDPGESPVAALRREILEETGWTIAAPRRVGAFRRYVFMPDYGYWAEKIYQVFTARPARQACDPSEPHHVPFWVTPEVALEILGEPDDRSYTRHALSMVFK